MPASRNVVLVHGAWADGSCWSEVIERLQADGYRRSDPETSLAADEGFLAHFAPDVGPIKTKVMCAVQQPLHNSTFNDVMGTPAWRSLPSWYLVAQNDQRPLRDDLPPGGDVRADPDRGERRPRAGVGL